MVQYLSSSSDGLAKSSAMDQNPVAAEQQKRRVVDQDPVAPAEQKQQQKEQQQQQQQQASGAKALNGDDEEKQLPHVDHEICTKTNARSLLKVSENRRAMLSAVPTLTLGIMGGAVLPVSWAFSITGITAGFLIMVVVAVANQYTCDLLLRQAYVTRTSDFETLAFAVGGRWWRLTTEISILILLVGTTIGSIAQVGEAGAIGLTSIWPNTPEALVGGSGRLIMVIGTLGIWPLCLVRGLRQLEYAGMLGTVMVVWLVFVVLIDSCKHGLPAIANGELPAIGFSSISSVTQAVSIFGFAFYIQPIMMPLLLEMPEGKVGVELTSWSTRIVVLGNAFVIYGVTGFFGAAYYGTNTNENILVNSWLGGGVAQGILNLIITVYLAIAIPMIELPTRHTINGWIPQHWIKHKLRRRLSITTTILSFSLTVAVIWPSKSGSALVVTGATGVGMVSYVIPVINHLFLYFSWGKCQKLPDLGRSERADLQVVQPSAKVYRQEPKSGRWWLLLEHSREVGLPLLVLVVGIFCSVASLTTL